MAKKAKYEVPEAESNIRECIFKSTENMDKSDQIMVYGTIKDELESMIEEAEAELDEG